MATSEKILLSVSNMYEYLDRHFNAAEFVSTMNAEGRAKVRARAEECFDRGDMDEGNDILGEIPLSPESALHNLLSPGLGVEFLKEGFNLADAEKAFGKDWMEKFEVTYEWI